MLEHRHEVGQYETLGVFILDTLKEACALPLPTVEALLEVFAVTLPKGDVAVLQAALHAVGPVEVAHDGRDGVACLPDALGRHVVEAKVADHVAALRAVIVGDEAVDVVAVDVNGERLTLQVGGQGVGNGLGDVGHVVGAHGHVLQRAIQENLNAVGRDGSGVDCYLSDVDALRETLQSFGVKVKGLR